MPSSRPLSAPVLVGLAAGLIPFFIHIRSSSSTRVNGQVVDSSTIGYVALAGGGVAVLAGVVALLGARTAPDKKRPMMFAAGVLLLGAVQLARGFGLF